MFEVRKIRKRMVRYFKYYPQSYRWYGKEIGITGQTFKEFVTGKIVAEPMTIGLIVKFLEENKQNELDIDKAQETTSG